jgi:hypothetical protein
MPLNQIVQELATVSGFLQPNNVLVTIVGQVVSCVPQVQVAPAYVLNRKPAGSSAAMSAGAFTCDLPGLYQATTTNAGNAITLWAIAAPAALFAVTAPTQSGGNTNPNAPKNPYGLQALQAIMNFAFGSWSASTFAATVEQATPAWPFGFNGALLGGSATSMLPWAAYGPAYP